MSSLKIKEWREQERPRERALIHGIRSLSETELIAILIRTGSREENAVEISRKLLQKCSNSLQTLLTLPLEKYLEISGIGKTKAITIMAALELSRRASIEDGDAIEHIHSSLSVQKIISPYLRDLKHEEFWVLFLDRSNKIVTKERLSSGGVSATVIDIKIILKKALEKLASAIILIHNHPSGNVNPSNSDKTQTKKIKSALSLFDIELLDHLIIAGSSYYSFADEGII